MEAEIKNEMKEILMKLNRLQSDVEYIKATMPGKDMFLTAEEETLLEESYENEKNSLLIVKDTEN